MRYKNLNNGEYSKGYRPHEGGLSVSSSRSGFWVEWTEDRRGEVIYSTKKRQDEITGFYSRSKELEQATREIADGK